MGGRYNNLFVNAIAVILLTVAGGVLEQKLTDKIRGLLFREKVAVAAPVVTRASLLEDEDDVYSRKKAMFRKDGEDAPKADAPKAEEETKKEEAKAEVKEEVKAEPKPEKPEEKKEEKAPEKKPSDNNKKGKKKKK